MKKCNTKLKIAWSKLSRSLRKTETLLKKMKYENSNSWTAAAMWPCTGECPALGVHVEIKKLQQGSFLWGTLSTGLLWAAISFIRNCYEMETFCRETMFLQEKFPWTNFSALEQPKWKNKERVLLVYSSKAKPERYTLFICDVDISDFSGIHGHFAAFSTGNYSVLNSKVLFMEWGSVL